MRLGEEVGMSSEELEQLVSTESSVDREMESRVSSGPVTDGDGEVVSASPLSSGTESSSVAPQAEWQGVVDYARSQGIELPYRDDIVAVRALLDAYRGSRERNYYADLGRQMAPYADQIQAWIQQNQGVQAQPQVDPYAAPEWNDQWALMVERDSSTGLIRSKPGYDPRIGEKAQAYVDWQSRWTNDPKFRDAYVEHRAESRARQLIDERFASHAESVQAQGIVSQNAAWIFQTHPDGSPVLGQDGMKVLSPAGHIYAQAVNQIWNSGVRNVDQCNALARAYVENAVMRQQFLAYQQAPAAQAQQAQGQVTPSVGGTATRPAVSPKAGRVRKEGMSLREMLNSTMNGFRDEDADAG